MALLVAHTTLLEIPCHGSYILTRVSVKQTFRAYVVAIVKILLRVTKNKFLH